MAKTFTKRPLGQFDQVKPESLNDNLDSYLAEYNGGLNGNNMPVNAVTDDHLIGPANVPGFTDIVGSSNSLHTKYPTQSYYSSDRWGWSQGGDEWTPLTRIDLDTDAWKRGFNSLRELSNWELFPLDFIAKEGMLVGMATIDWDHGTNVFNVQVVDEPPSNGPRARGFDWWTEWGVFVNNILVARSGHIFPRRHTTCLPFSIPVGSQAVEIDVRFIANTNRAIGGSGTGLDSTTFNIYGAEIVCRNHYR